MRRTPVQKRQTLLFILSIIVVASMVCSFVVMLRPPQPAAAPVTSEPTLIIPTWTPEPTQAPTRAAPTAEVPTAQATAPEATPLPTVTATAVTSPTISAMNGAHDLAFAVCGDNRDGPQVYQKILDAVQQDGSAFLINTGDLVSSGTEGEFQEFARQMSSFKLPFYPVPGNHDNGDGLLTSYLKYSGAPAPHYSFDYGPLHLAIIDTSLGDFTEGERDWLTKDLDSTTQPVKVVAMHFPAFDPAGTDHIMRSGNQQFMDLMKEEKVRLVLAGHIHSYDSQMRDGVQYVITGGGGAPLYPAPNREAYYHYLRVMVKGEEISTEVVRVAA